MPKNLKLSTFSISTPFIEYNIGLTCFVVYGMLYNWFSQHSMISLLFCNHKCILFNSFVTQLRRSSFGKSSTLK